MEMKACIKCGEVQPHSEFYWNGNRKSRKNTCKVCYNAATRTALKARWAENPSLARAKRKKLYWADPSEHRRRARISTRKRFLAGMGMTFEDIEQAFEEQGGVCAICSHPVCIDVMSRAPSERKTHVDHCHETMQFRGILCHLCNSGLGMFKDSPDLLIRAANYLEKRQEQGISVPKVAKPDYAAEAMAASPSARCSALDGMPTNSVCET
jgi:hypothetical protein